MQLNFIWLWNSSRVFSGMWSTPLVPLLSGPLRAGILLPFSVPFVDQIEIFNHFLLWSYSITSSDCSCINPVSALAVFKRSTKKKWHNPSGTYSEGWSFGTKFPGNSKTRRTLRQQLTIIYCSMFRLHTVAQERERERERERESVRVFERTQRDTPSPTELSEWKLLAHNWPTG